MVVGSGVMAADGKICMRGKMGDGGTGGTRKKRNKKKEEQEKRRVFDLVCW